HLRRQVLRLERNTLRSWCWWERPAIKPVDHPRPPVPLAAIMMTSNVPTAVAAVAFVLAVLTTTVKAQENFKCPDDFGFYPHHISCDKYWKCDNNVAELKTCGNGLAFDASDPKFLTENCDYIHNVDCGDRNQLEPPIAAPHCERLYGIFPDEAKCDVFWNCWNGEASRYQCSPGLAYDREARVCMWADQVPECKTEGQFCMEVEAHAYIIFKATL
ncbi:unnamed protein product, partial [Callosobruchus maculatus]